MVTDRQTTTLLEVLERARTEAPLLYSSLHGEKHWQHVAIIGSRLVAATKGADLELVLLFAVLHDSCRQNENYDPEHGHRAADLLDELHASRVVALESDRHLRLRDAVARHDSGAITTDPAIGACWDADRLCLPRVWIEPREELLSTRAGRSLGGWARSVLDHDLRDWRAALIGTDALAAELPRRQR